MTDFNESYDDDRIETSVGFQYPQDEPETPTNQTSELLLHLVFLLLESKNPKLKLICMCYSTGIDVGYLLQCENTMTAIADKLGVSKQNFHKEVKKVVTQLHLNPQHVNGHKTTNTTEYKYANFIKPSV